MVAPAVPTAMVIHATSQLVQIATTVQSTVLGPGLHRAVPAMEHVAVELDMQG